MTTDKNALAELAERMAVVTSGHGDTWRWLEDVSKAQRIVTELAKAYRLNAYGVIRISSNVTLYDVICKCRSIAEEV